MLTLDIATLKEHVSINRNTDWVSIKPFVKDAEQNYIIPNLSEDQYNALLNAIAGTPTPAQNALLYKVQQATAHWTLFDAIPQLNSFVSNMGVQQAESSDGTSKPAPMWQVRDLRASHYNLAVKYTEQLLKFLQENKADYPLWVASQSYTEYNDLLIRNSTELSKHLNTGDSILTMVAIRPYIYQAEFDYLAPCISTELLAEIKTQRSQSNLNPNNAKLLPLAQRALAAAAFAAAIVFLPDVVTNGVLTLNPYGNVQAQDRDTDMRFAKKVTAAEMAREKALADLKHYLHQNIANYPTYSNSSSYNNLQPNFNLFENTSDGAFMV